MDGGQEVEPLGRTSFKITPCVLFPKSYLDFRAQLSVLHPAQGWSQHDVLSQLHRETITGVTDLNTKRGRRHRELGVRCVVISAFTLGKGF